MYFLCFKNGLKNKTFENLGTFNNCSFFGQANQEVIIAWVMVSNQF